MSRTLSTNGKRTTESQEKGKNKNTKRSFQYVWICELIDESKAIWIACKGGHITVLKKLLKCPGVNINVIGSSGSTPLMMAKQGKHPDIIARSSSTTERFCRKYGR